MANAKDVAAAIIEEVGEVDQLKLQKLLYYAQGWSMAWRKTPLFPEPVEAWRLGPVVNSVYQDYRAYGPEYIRKPESGSIENLSDEERDVVAAVVDRYRRLSGKALSEYTHEDSAWSRAWNRRSSAERGRQTIPPASIARSLLRPDDGAPVPHVGVDVDPVLLEAAIEGDGAALLKLLETASNQ